MLESQSIVAETENEITRKCEARRRRIANLKPIKKGQVLNPRGRPKKDLDLAQLAQKHAERAIATLAQCLTDPVASWPARVSAASELLDRGFGRPPQCLDLKHEVTFGEQFETFIRRSKAGRDGNVIEAEAVHAATCE